MNPLQGREVYRRHTTGGWRRGVGLAAALVAVLGLLATTTTTSVAQTLKMERLEWYRQYDHHAQADEAWHIHQLTDSSGGYLLTGVTREDGFNQAFFQVLDSVGAEVAWDKLDWLGAGESRGFELHPTKTPQAVGFAYIFAGQFTDPSGYRRALVMGLNRNGSDFDTVWCRLFPENDPDTEMAAFSVQQVMTDGVSDGFIVAGFARPRGTDNYHETDGLLIRLDHSGAPVDSGWPLRVDVDSNVDAFKSVRVSDNGQAYVASGFTRHTDVLAGDPGDQFDVLMVKVGPDTSRIWTRTIGPGNTGELGEGMKPAEDGAGGWVVTGGRLHSETGFPDPHLIKTDASGNPEWTSVVSTVAINDYGQSVISVKEPDHTPAYIVTGAAYYGSSVGPADEADIIITRFDHNGQLQYHRYVGEGSALDHGYWVQPTADSGFVITGTTFRGAGVDGPSDIVVMKFAPAREICGDVNENGVINSTDVIYLTNHIFKGGPSPCAASADTWCADVNGSCPDIALTSADIIYLIGYVFKSGPAPVCPWCLP